MDGIHTAQREQLSWEFGSSYSAGDPERQHGLVKQALALELEKWDLFPGTVTYFLFLGKSLLLSGLRLSNEELDWICKVYSSSKSMILGDFVDNNT